MNPKQVQLLLGNRRQYLSVAIARLEKQFTDWVKSNEKRFIDKIVSLGELNDLKEEEEEEIKQVPISLP